MVSLFLVLLAAVPAIAVPEEIQYHHARRDNENPDRIIHGVPADIEEFPFFVSFKWTHFDATRNETSSAWCGGSIITESWVLTAAHCLGPDDPSTETIVRAGSRYYAKGGVVRYGIKQVSNEYPPHDIGLIKVDEPWPLNGITISLARLPRQDDPIPVGSPATIMGWGVTDENGTIFKILMKGEVLVISHYFCRVSLIWFLHWITDQEICTSIRPGKLPSQTIQGDSGGPVLVNGEVAGIVSWSLKLPVIIKFPDVHTRVSSYIDWIEQNVGPLPRDM